MTKKILEEYFKIYPGLVESKHMFVQKGMRENQGVPVFFNKKEVEEFSVLLNTFLSSKIAKNLLLNNTGINWELNNGLDTLGEKEHTLYLTLSDKKSLLERVFQPGMSSMESLSKQWLKKNGVKELKKDFNINIDISVSNKVHLEAKEGDALLWDLLNQFYDWSLSRDIEEKDLVERVFLADQMRSKVIIHKLIDHKKNENTSEKIDDINQFGMNKTIDLLAKIRKMNCVSYDNVFIYDKEFMGSALNKTSEFISKIRQDFNIKKSNGLLTTEYKEALLGLLLLTHPSGVYFSFLVGHREYLKEYNSLMVEAMEVLSHEEKVKYKVDIWYLNGDKISNMLTSKNSHLFWEKRAYFNIEQSIEILKYYEERIEIENLLEPPVFINKEMLANYVDIKKVECDDDSEVSFLLDLNKFGSFLKIDKYSMQHNMNSILYQIFRIFDIDMKILQNNVNNLGFSYKYDDANAFFVSDLRYYCYFKIDPNQIEGIKKRDEKLERQLRKIMKLYCTSIVNLMIDNGVRNLNDIQGKFLTRSLGDNLALLDLSNRFKSILIEPKLSNFTLKVDVMENISNIVRESMLLEEINEIDKKESVQRKRKI